MSSKRRWLKVLTVTATLTAIVGALAYVHHIRGARFRATATPIEWSSFDDCVAALTREPYLYSDEASSSICRGEWSDVWFLAQVTNVGHRGAYLTGCTVEAFDEAGDQLYSGDLGVGPGLHADSYLGPGESVEVRWYILPRPKSTQRAARYVVSCEPIDYHGKAPV
jgi:hypothetical protein